MLMRAAIVVQILQTCFMFYCMFYFTCDRSFTALNAFLDRDECFRFEGQKVRVQGHSGIEYAHVSTFTKFYVLIPCVFLTRERVPNGYRHCCCCSQVRFLLLSDFQRAKTF